MAATAVPLGRGRVFCLFDDAMISMRYLGHLAGPTYVPFGEMWLRRGSAHLRWDRLPPASRAEP